MLDGLFRQNLNSLVNKDSRSVSQKQLLQEAPAIQSARGQGLARTQGSFSNLTDAGKSQKKPTLASVRMEVITLWSSIVLTEDGAFEMPPGWPANGDYPAGAFMASPPPSITVTGGTYTLDTTVAHYVQKRVHLVTYQNEVGDELTEDRFLLPLAAPFEGQGFMQGYNIFAQSSPGVIMTIDCTDGFGRAYEKVTTRLQELLALVGNITVNRL